MEFIKPEETDDKLKGLTFVITGDVEHFKNEEMSLKRLLNLLEEKVTGSVTGKTSYLINNDKESASSKNKAKI